MALSLSLSHTKGVKYCVRYALTQLPSCIFSSQSYRFGYEYNQTMVYWQADAIAKCIQFTREVQDTATYQGIIQNLMAVMNQYLASNLTYQGDPHIAPYLIQTDQNTGITPQNIENSITLLTYDTVRERRFEAMARSAGYSENGNMGFSVPLPTTMGVQTQNVQSQSMQMQMNDSVSNSVMTHHV